MTKISQTSREMPTRVFIITSSVVQPYINFPYNKSLYEINNNILHKFMARVLTRALLRLVNDPFSIEFTKAFSDLILHKLQIHFQLFMSRFFSFTLSFDLLSHLIFLRMCILHFFVVVVVVVYLGREVKSKCALRKHFHDTQQMDCMFFFSHFFNDLQNQSPEVSCKTMCS